MGGSKDKNRQVVNTTFLDEALNLRSARNSYSGAAAVGYTSWRPAAEPSHRRASSSICVLYAALQQSRRNRRPGATPAAVGDAGQHLQDDPVGQERRDLSRVVRRRNLDHVDARDRQLDGDAADRIEELARGQAARFWRAGSR